EAEKIVRAQSQGVLSLALRPLVNSDAAVASNGSPSPANLKRVPTATGGDDQGDQVSIIRYGETHQTSTAVQGGKPQ
ncbi:MAG TPA: hypothetical protein VGI89_03310, partial [Rhizomicrobium sp.]